MEHITRAEVAKSRPNQGALVCQSCQPSRGSGGPFAVNPPLSNISPGGSDYHRGTKEPSGNRIRDGWTELHEYSKKVIVGLQIA